MDMPKLHDLTLDQKLGQMLLVGFRGKNPDPGNPIVSDIRDRHIGGVILFDYDSARKSYDRNIASPEQVSELTAWLAGQAEIPLFVSIDQEGGVVNRLKPEYGFPASMSHRELGEMADPELTFRHSREIAVTLRRHGFNLNFAPCVDLGINRENKAIFGRDRCFSDDPETAAIHASAYIRGHHEENILTAIKHFPGHGSARDDTHLGMADVTDSWLEYEMLPYQRVLEEQICDMVMTTHIFNRRLDPDWPATLSARILDDMLRARLGHDGVIITDDLQMKAISSHYGRETAIRRALLAGADILLYGNNMEYDPEASARFLHTAKEMLDRGELEESRINASAARILKLKSRQAV
jgi:beta-N-acetylhexosaminidase